MQTLIDKASAICGSDAALARELGVSKAYVSQMRHRQRPVPPEIAGIMADIAGEKIGPVVMAALLDQIKDTPRGQRVKEALERDFLAFAAGIFGISATSSEGIGSGDRSQFVNKIYIVLSGIRALVSKVARIHRTARTPARGVRCSVVAPQT